MSSSKKQCADRQASREGGFSLVELLIVVSIIGILTALAVPGLVRARATASEARAIGFVRTWAGAQELYKERTGIYAPTVADLIQAQLINTGMVGTVTDDSGYNYAILTADSTSWFGRATPRPGLGTRVIEADNTGAIYGDGIALGVQ